MLLGDGQGGTVNPLVNLLPLLCLKGIESFPSVTHPKDTRSKEGKVSGITVCVCVCAHANSKCQLWVDQGLQGEGGRGLGNWPQYTGCAVVTTYPVEVWKLHGNYSFRGT